MINEKHLQRKLLMYLLISFAVFCVLFAILSVVIIVKVDKEYQIEKYRTVGKAFSFVVDKEIISLNFMSNLVIQKLYSGNLETIWKELKRYNPNMVLFLYEKSKNHTTSFGLSELLPICKSQHSTYEIFKRDSKVYISISKLTPYGRVCLIKDISDVLSKINLELGGKFEMVDEVSKNYEEILKEKEILVVNKEGKYFVYYNLNIRSLQHPIYIKWVYQSKTLSMAQKIFMLIVLMTIPFFVILYLIVSKFKKQIFSQIIEPMKKLIFTLDDLIVTTSSSSQELAASSQELAASTKELEEKSRTVNELVENVVNEFEKTEDFSKNVSEFTDFLTISLSKFEKIVTEMFEAIQEINKMGGFIQQIGERIVVLSINASIEGSRETIDRQAIKALAEEIGNLSETTSERVNEIFILLQNALDKLDELNNAFKSITTETERLQLSSKKLLEMIKDNKNDFKKITESIQAIFAAVEEINLASQNLAESATELSSKAYDAQHIIDEFGKNNSKGGEDDV